MNYKDLNDYEICYYVRENDDEALNLMFNKYSNLINKIALKFYNKFKYIGIDLEDLVQEARIGFVKALKGYNDESSLFYSFASICMEREVISYCRRYNTFKNYPLNYSTDYDLLYNYPITDEIDSVLQENEIFFENKNKLDFKLSIVFELRYNNFTYSEISELLDLPYSTVNSRLARVKRILKTI